MRHALVAGAGIGGLCAALSLARGGWRVSLFEQADALKEVGAGLQISPNASIILQRLGVLDALRPACLAPVSIEILGAADGATLASIPLGDAAERWGAPYLLAHRADLQRALAEAASCENAIELCTGSEVTSFISGAGSVGAEIRQGTQTREISGDCLIGADGSRSTIRRQMRAGRADARMSATRTAWRTLVDPAKAPARMRGDQTFLWLGRKAHLVHYPLRNGAVLNVVAIVESGADADALSGWSTPGEAARLEARFSDWHSSARALLAAAPGWRVWPLFDRDPIADWTAGRVALLGDAAHPMLPFLAQGAAQAIEDAAALGEALSPDRDVAQSLIVYQNARQARAARVQKTSRRQGDIYHLSGAAAAARNLAFRALGGRGLRARQDWLYDARRQLQPPESF